MDRLAELKLSLTDLSPEEQLELIRERRAERMTKPFRPKRVSKKQGRPKIANPDSAKRKAFEKVDKLLDGKSIEDIMEIAKRLGVKK